MRCLGTLLRASCIENVYPLYETSCDSDSRRITLPSIPFGKAAGWTDIRNHIRPQVDAVSMPVEEKTAKHGEKTIRVSLKFWTDGIASEKGKVVPGYCWEGGFVNVEANPTHGLRATQPVPFNTFDELVPMLVSVLDDAGVHILFNPRKRSRRPRASG